MTQSHHIQRVIFLKRVLSSQGGLEKYATQLAKKFASLGLHISFCYQEGSAPCFPIKGIHVSAPRFCFPFQKIRHFDKHYRDFLPQDPQTLIFGLDRNHYQHIYRAGNGVHAFYLDQRKQQAPFYKRLELELNPLQNTLLAIEKKAFESPELRYLITNSHFVKSQVLNYYQIPEKKVQVIHNGVEWHEMQAPFEQSFEIKKSSLGFKNDVPLIVFIGNGWERKGLKPLLLSLSVLSQKKIPFQLAVIGKERQISDYQSLAKKYKIDPNVYFVGPQANVLPFYQVADLVAIPSYYDPFANVTLEALAMGIKVLSSNTNGAHEILTPDHGAIFDLTQAADELTESLEKLLAKPKNYEEAKKIRNSVKKYDFSLKLKEITDLSLSL